jgi:hypothetical protein
MNLETHEVNDVGANRFLALEVASQEPLGPQIIPEALFGVG